MSKPEDVIIPHEVDFVVKFHTEKGWQGTFRDENVDKNGVVNLEKASLQKGDVIRGIVQGMVDGLWVVQAIILKGHSEGTIIPTHKDKKGRWHCIYPNEKGVAMVGHILHSPRMLTEELVVGRPYLAHRCNDNFYELELE